MRIEMLNIETLKVMIKSCTSKVPDLQNTFIQCSRHEKQRTMIQWEEFKRQVEQI